MWARNRTFSVLTAISYSLTITVAALFHNHGGDFTRGNGQCAYRASAGENDRACNHGADDEGRSCPVAPHHRSGEGDCQVCQFLAQKPALAEDLPPPSFESMVEEVAAPAPARVETVSFSAWRSRAPPSVA